VSDGATMKHAIETAPSRGRLVKKEEGLTVYVGDAVDESSWAENVGVLGEEGDAGRAEVGHGQRRGVSMSMSASNCYSTIAAETYEMILCLCLRDLKCGSGNRKNSFLSCSERICEATRYDGQRYGRISSEITFRHDARLTWPFSKKFVRNFMAFPRMTDTFWYLPGWINRWAITLSCTYCVTCTRISIPERTRGQERAMFRQFDSQCWDASREGPGRD
jgi:hypothetical protein